MNTQRVLALLVLATVMGGGSSAVQSAEQDAVEDQQVAEARAMVQAARDEMIEADMGLSEAEGEGFWPLYRSYRAELIAVQDRYVSMVRGYVKAYEAGEISDEYAEKLLDDWLKYKEDLLRVKKQHVEKFSAVLPIRKVVRFYQLENKMDVETEAELAIVVPLMESF